MRESLCERSIITGALAELEVYRECEPREHRAPTKRRRLRVAAASRAVAPISGGAVRSSILEFILESPFEPLVRDLADTTHAAVTLRGEGRAREKERRMRIAGASAQGGGGCLCVRVRLPCACARASVGCVCTRVCGMYISSCRLERCPAKCLPRNAPPLQLCAEVVIVRRLAA